MTHSSGRACPWCALVLAGAGVAGCDSRAVPPPRTVTGSLGVTYWPDGGKLAPVPVGDPSLAVRAHVVGAGGSDAVLDGTFAADGTFRIEGVPAGRYLLELASASASSVFFATESGEVDLGWDVLGRPDQRPVTVATPVTFELSGLRPTTAQDVVEVTSSNANVWDYIAPAGTLPAGVTAVSPVFDWSARRTNAVDGALGDRVLVHQLSAHVDPSTRLPYLAASAWAELPASFGVQEGTAQTVPVTLSPVADVGTLATTWRLQAFDDGLGDWPAGAMVVQHLLAVEAFAWTMDGGPEAAGYPDLLVVSAPPGAGDLSLALDYGRFLPAPWTEFLETRTTVRLAFRWQGATLTTLVTQGAIAPLGASPAAIAPAIGPARALRVAGRDGSVTQTGVGAAPELSWTAPRVGAADAYLVDVTRLDVSGTYLTALRVASFQTPETRLQLPQGMLAPGAWHVVSVQAFAAPAATLDTAPYRFHAPVASAGTTTAPFMP